MKTYDEITHKEIQNPDLTKGFLYEGIIVTGRTEETTEMMKDTISDINPEGLYRVVPAKDIVEQCQWYHAYTEEEINEKKDEKLNEISESCNAMIVKGSDVELSNKEIKHFTYSIEDQSNISEMFNAVIMGAEAYPYHADNESCMMYSASDIVLIYVALSSLKTGQTTYHNMLKQYVKTLTTYSDINAVKYGQELTGEYLTTYNALMESAQNEMKKILQKVSTYVS